MSKTSPLYKRVLLKLSGEALMGEQKFGLSATTLSKIASEIAKLQATGVELGIVVGGGNFLRGASLQKSGANRAPADSMGMLATVMNSIALQDALRQQGLSTSIMASVTLPGIAEVFQYDIAQDKLKSGQIMIFAGGTGNPFFTTDTAACLRGIEIEADVVFKATKVDGVFDKDPVKFADAKFYQKLDYAEVIAQNLGVMDMTAIILCQEHAMPLRVISMLDEDNLQKAVISEDIGTLITS